jgi:hypothetical protein
VYFTSANSHSTIKKSPFGQFLRLRRICSMDYDFEVESNKMIRHYIKRGYPKNLLQKHYQNAKIFSQEELLKPKVKTLTNREIMVTTYNPNNPDIMKIIKKHWNIIEFSDDCNTSFSHNPMLGLRKQPNLNNMLCRANIEYPPKNMGNNKRLYRPLVCQRLAKCRYCPKIYNNKKQLFITSTNRIFNNRFLPDNRSITCEISNVIYCITCKKCNLQYVGETGRPIRNRIYEHIYSITKADNKLTPVSRHFHLPHHSPNDLIFHIIEDCNLLTDSNDPNSQRKRREMFWIWTLNPYGINMAT